MHKPRQQGDDRRIAVRMKLVQSNHYTTLTWCDQCSETELIEHVLYGQEVQMRRVLHQTLRTGLSGHVGTAGYAALALCASAEKQTY